jgi:hypothetical protein
MIKRAVLLGLMALAAGCHEPQKGKEVVVLREDMTKVEIIHLQHADATEVAQKLQATYKSWPRLVVDQRNNSIVVRATTDLLESVRAKIHELDREEAP